MLSFELNRLDLSLQFEVSTQHQHAENLKLTFFESRWVIHTWQESEKVVWKFVWKFEATNLEQKLSREKNQFHDEPDAEASGPGLPDGTIS
jgi:hypothetical protein